MKFSKASKQLRCAHKTCMGVGWVGSAMDLGRPSSSHGCWLYLAITRRKAVSSASACSLGLGGGSGGVEKRSSLSEGRSCTAADEAPIWSRSPDGGWVKSDHPAPSCDGSVIALARSNDCCEEGGVWLGGSCLDSGEVEGVDVSDRGLLLANRNGGVLSQSSR